MSLIILFVLSAGMAVAIVVISQLIGRRESSAERGIPYECGLNPVDRKHGRLSVKFFLVAVLFIVFDVEVVFLYPLAIAFREAASLFDQKFLLIELVAFLAILAVALAYSWGRGGLEWDK